MNLMSMDRNDEAKSEDLPIEAGEVLRSEFSFSYTTLISWS